MAKTDEQILCCSFCGKQESQARLIAGPGVCICSDCVQACCDLLQQDSNNFEMPEKLPTPMEMKAYMVNRLAVMLIQQHEGMSMQEALSMVFQSE